MPPCSLLLCPRGPKRSAQEGPVARQSEQSVRTLEVQSMCEPSHLAEECLVRAYERRVPILSRCLPVTSTTAPANPPSPKRRIGGKQS